MPGLSSLVELLILWLFFGASVFLVYLAIRAGQVEREEGLPRSKARLWSSVAVCAVMAVLAMLSTMTTFRIGGKDSSRSEVALEAATPIDREKLEQLKRDREKLRKQIEELEKSIAALTRERSTGKSDTADSGSLADTESTQQGSGFDFLPFARYLVPLLLVVGLVLFFWLGDPGVLLRLKFFRLERGDNERRMKTIRDLNVLAALAQQGRYQDGLAQADKLDSNLLERFDRLDWAYLKSYCAVQAVTEGTVAADKRRGLLETATRLLTTLLEEAPNRGEAAYLLGMARGMLDEPQGALDSFAQSKKLLPTSLDLPFAHNESVALLDLAEQKLSQGDTTGSSQLFDRVTALKVLVDQIPASLVKIRLLNVRKALQAKQLEDATKGIETVRTLPGLDAEQKRNVGAICDAMQALIAVRRGDDLQIASQLDAFLATHAPSNLPLPDDKIADEYLDTPLAGIELPIAPQIYRAFLFLKAEVAARKLARLGRALTAPEVDEIAAPLRRALQFELRQRDVLAALACLYYWFVPEKKPDALRWLQAAVDLGVDSRITRRLLERTKQIEVENREALDWFRSTSVRFLHDPTVSAKVRSALVEELGRFQGFEPLLLDLDLDNDVDAREPTLGLVRERAGYLQKMAAEFVLRKAGAIGPELDALSKDYARLVGSLDASMSQMADLERRVVQAIGTTVLS